MHSLFKECPTYLRDRKRLDEVKAIMRSDNEYTYYIASVIGKAKVIVAMIII